MLLAILTQFEDRKKCTVPTGPFFLFFPTFQRLSCFPVFFPVFFTVLFFFFFFLFFFKLKSLTDPGKPGKPRKINQFYQSHEKVRDFFYTEDCVYTLSFIFKND